MTSSRKQILQWKDQGHLGEASLPAALLLAKATPRRQDWFRFIDSLMLWCGAIFLAAGVIFFFAYNWQEMGRYTKFGLIEAAIVTAVAICWMSGLDRLPGKVALFAASLLVGALLALVGQTYQTGADPWQLFAIWAMMTLPWVLISRFSALLLFWVGLVNLSLLLYFQTFPRSFGLIGLLFSTETLLWALFVFNTLILCVWELAAWRGRVAWLDERWPIRVLAVASGGLITTLAVWAILEFRSFHGYALLGYMAWLGGIYVAYRHKLPDVFVLAGAVLSVIIVVTAGLGKLLLDHGGSAASLLLIGVTTIGLSAAGGYWLKSIAGEQRS